MMVREISFREAITEAMAEEMRRDRSVYLMGEDVGRYGGLLGTTFGLIEEFGARRVIETPISEPGFVGAAVVTAVRGLRPILEMGLADVLLTAMDHVVNSAAKMNYFYNGQTSTPMVLRVASGFRPSGGPQMSQSNEAMFAHVPGLKVVMPSTPHDVKGLLKASIRDDNPVIFFEPKRLYSMRGPVPAEDYTIPLGVAEIKRHGSDVTVVALGAMVSQAQEAASRLQEENISVEIVDPRTVRPLDAATVVRSVEKTGRVLIVHEANVIGGIGGEIAATLADRAFLALRAPIKRLGAREIPVPVSPVMERWVVPNVENIIEAVRSLLTKPSTSEG
jgi:acetoin:2,6-dichlorophenolindophenol oxidoreductase subunit beta